MLGKASEENPALTQCLLQTTRLEGAHQGVPSNIDTERGRWVGSKGSASPKSIAFRWPRSPASDSRKFSAQPRNSIASIYQTIQSNQYIAVVVAGGSEPSRKMGGHSQ